MLTSLAINNRENTSKNKCAHVNSLRILDFNIYHFNMMPNLGLHIFAELLCLQFIKFHDVAFIFFFFAFCLGHHII